MTQHYINFWWIQKVLSTMAVILFFTAAVVTRLLISIELYRDDCSLYEAKSASLVKVNAACIWSSINSNLINSDIKIVILKI